MTSCQRTLALGIACLVVSPAAADEPNRPAAAVLSSLPDNTWVRLVAEKNGPWKRNYCGMCFDSREGRVLSWGGAHFSYPGNEVQAYRVGADRWGSLNERHVPPVAVRWWGGGTPGSVDPLGQPLAAHSYDDLVYDPVGHQMIWLPFGGNGAWHFDLDDRRWRLRMPAERPEHGFAACSAYVSHGRLIATATPRSDHLYLYDIARGTFSAESKLPERPYNSGMTYDSQNKLVVLAGGKLEDTWLYSIDKKTWRKTDRDGGPQGVHAVGVTFDSVNNVVIVAGAEKLDGRQTRNRTWILDTSTGKWTDPAPRGQPDVPLAGIFGSLVFDPKRNVALVTWGHDWRGKCETWAYRYRARAVEPIVSVENTAPRPRARKYVALQRPQPKPLPTVGWKRLNPGEPPPSPWFRGLSGAVFCDAADRVFFWGRGAGNSAGSKMYAEFFRPDSGDSEQVGEPKPGEPGPPLELTFSMLSVNKECGGVVFPYVCGDPARSRTWLFDLSENWWRELKTNTQPRVVPLSAAASDGYRTVLFGGSFDGEPQTWLFDGKTHEWRNTRPKTSPSARVWHSMTYDAQSGLFVLFGGHDGKCDLGDTWLYDRSKNTWTEVTPPAQLPSPGPRCGHGMAYDQARGGTILFGGHTTRYSDETDEEAYLYQNSHSDRGVVHADTWLFDSATRSWTLLAPATSPPPAPTVCGAMVYDRRRGQTILMHPWKPRGPAARQYNTCQVWALGGDGSQ